MAKSIKSMLGKWFPASWSFAWAFTLVALPITSFPFLAKLAGGTLVAPLSIFPLLWLVLTWLPYHLFNKKSLPGELKPFLLFICFTLFSSGLAFYIKMPNYKGHTIQNDEFEALITLGIGFAFLLITITRNQSMEDIKKSLAWINIGGIVFLIWSLMQIVIIVFFKGSYPQVISTIQKLISISNLSSSISGGRISGFTLEPSWLAHSLNMLYIPLWLAASRFNVSAFRFRVGKITIENMLLGAGIIAIIMTYSRIGLISFFAFLVWFMFDIAGLVSKKIAARKKNNNPRLQKTQKRFITGLLVIVLCLSFVLLLYALSFQDNRISKIFNSDGNNNKLNIQSSSLISLAKKANFGERLVYWDFGWKVFNEYPVFGVGLGNVGRFSEQLLSHQAWKMSEVRQFLLYTSSLPNTKNLWVRILSETGLVGFSFYATWLIVLWFAGRNLYKHATPSLKAIGLAGQFVIIAHLFEGFSLDTFALPYVWISFGILIASIALPQNRSIRI